MNWVQEKFFSKELEAEYIGIDVASEPDEACGALIKDGQTVAIIRGSKQVSKTLRYLQLKDFIQNGRIVIP